MSKPCGCSGATPAPALVLDSGNVMAWCVRHGDALVCWQWQSRVPVDALRYVSENHLTNPRPTSVVPADATWPNGAPT